MTALSSRAMRAGHDQVDHDYDGLDTAGSSRGSDDFVQWAVRTWTNPGGVGMTESIRALLEQPFELAEGPVWFQGLLWWVDIMAGTLHRCDPTSQRHESRDTGDLLGVAVPCTDGRWLLAQNRSLVVFDWEQGTSKVIATLDNEGPATAAMTENAIRKVGSGSAR